MNNFRFKKLAPVLIVAFVAILALVVFWAVSQSRLTAKITVEVAPSGSVIKLNGRGVREGTVKVRPGTYMVEFSHDGFASQILTVSVLKGQEEYAGVALESNSPETASWYQTHSDDALKAEGITGKGFDETARVLEITYPIIKDLPYIDQEFRVDYGRSEKEPTNPEVIAIVITHYTEAGKQQALDWLRSKGTDPASLEIIYKSQAFSF